MIIQKTNISKLRRQTIKSERFSLFSNNSVDNENFNKIRRRKQSSLKNKESKRRAMYKLSLINHFNLKKTALTCVKIGLNNKSTKKFRLQFYEISLMYKLLLFIRSLCVLFYSFVTISIFKALNLNENQEKFKNIIFFISYFIFLFLFVILIKKESTNNFILIFYVISYFMFFISHDIILGCLKSNFSKTRKYLLLYFFL